MSTPGNKTKECLDSDREYIECDSKNICPTGMVSNGPGCYCKNGQYLYQPTNECVDPADPRCFPPPALFPSVNLCKLLTNSMTCCLCGMCFALICLLQLFRIV